MGPEKRHDERQRKKSTQIYRKTLQFFFDTIKSVGSTKADQKKKGLNNIPQQTLSEWISKKKKE